MMTEQAGPLDSCGPDIADMLCDEIMKRKAFGIDKYGKPLRPNNGRKALVDLLAELLDGAHYALQEHLEREALAETLDALAAELEKDAATADREEELVLLGRAWGLRRAARMVRGELVREDEE